MADTENKEPALEERLQELEKVTASLESGELSINDAIDAYSRGMELAASCRKSLDEMTQKVTVARLQAQKLNEPAGQLGGAAGQGLPPAGGQVPF